MKYLDFRNSVQRALFSGSDVDVVRTGVHSLQMNRWVAKGYITRVVRGLFVFSDKAVQIDRRAVAFRLYEPSYVSLESALSLHGLIPEIVPTTTCVSRRTTRTFTTPLGTYLYRHVQDGLYWGYGTHQTSDGVFLLAEPEKALLDYVYFNTHRIQTDGDVSELRLNPFEWKEKVNEKKLMEYAARFDSPVVMRATERIISYMCKINS